MLAIFRLFSAAATARMPLMAKWTFLLLIGLSAPAVAAEPLTAESALGKYRLSVHPLECPKRGDGEIVVCGRSARPDPNRLPLPIDRPPGEIVPGEATASAGKLETCSNVGPVQQCGGGLPVMAIALFAVKTAIKLIEKDD
jgi:hypothetical protein